MKSDYKNWIPKGMLFSLIEGTMLPAHRSRRYASRRCPARSGGRSPSALPRKIVGLPPNYKQPFFVASFDATS